MLCADDAVPSSPPTPRHSLCEAGFGARARGLASVCLFLVLRPPERLGMTLAPLSCSACRLSVG
eukprot:6456271-Prymnesium_polylepis.1